ncbi:MAG: hypothetical protein D3922_06070, partial [Candidatus Electrothrix sp. AR1]|nr:hypothetical protein [Candidatus Electrothrix sp. AR1]
ENIGEYFFIYFFSLGQSHFIKIQDIHVYNQQQNITCRQFRLKNGNSYAFELQKKTEDEGFYKPIKNAINTSTWSPVLTHKMKWNEARIYCNNYTAADHSNWRLPTLDELEGANKDTLGVTEQKVWAEQNNRPAYFNFETGDPNSNVDSERSRNVLCTAD